MGEQGKPWPFSGGKGLNESCCGGSPKEQWMKCPAISSLPKGCVPVLSVSFVSRDCFSAFKTSRIWEICRIFNSNYSQSLTFSAFTWRNDSDHL